MSNTFLGIDIGTSGIRGCCIDENGLELATHAISIESPALIDGRSEQDPEIWWQTTKTIIRYLVSSAGVARIKAIAIDGTSGTVLLTDENGVPVSNALMYNDQSALQQARQISAIAPPDSAAHGASSGLAKGLYLFERHPDATHLCHQADWINAKLTGNFAISDENNCLKTGYDPVKQNWPDFIQTLGLPAKLLPEVVTPGTKTGVVQKKTAETLGLDCDCTVFAGTTDSIAAFIATGATQIGTGATSLGSTLSLKMITDKPVFSAQYGIYSHRLGDNWLVGGASNSGGRVLQQFFNNEELETLSSTINTNETTGLDYYPLPAIGERFPICDPNLKPKIEPRPENDAHFLHALLEGIASIEKQGYEKLAALSETKLTKVITSGGGSINTVWTKIREKLIAVPIHSATQTEASYGAAKLALQGYTKTRE